MRYLSVCSGIEAATVAWQQLTFDHEGHLAGTETPPAPDKEKTDGE
jgi:hypothetical protein